MDFNISNEGDERKDILLKYSKIVLVGACDVGEPMRERGYSVICVNHPHEKIADVPDEDLEILYVSLPSEDIPKIVDEVIISKKIPKVFWMQKGVRSEYARKMLEPRDVRVVEDSNIVEAYATAFADPPYEAILRFLRKYASAKGLALNPNPQELNRVITGLAHNQKEKGFRYCPCRPLSGDPKEDAKKICPCFWHRDEIKKDGRCHCNLFWSKDCLK